MCSSDLDANITEQDIYSLVNMILHGFIIDGEITEEYRLLASQALSLRRSIDEQNTGSNIIGLDGQRIQ